MMHLETQQGLQKNPISLLNCRRAHDSIERIEKALIGDDSQGGLVAKVKEIDGKIAVQES